MTIRFVKRNPDPIEMRKRIQVSVWAWAYENYDFCIVDDATFDRVCREIDLKKDTNNPAMDLWFRENFDRSTGSWVHLHPNLKRIDAIVQSLMN